MNSYTTSKLWKLSNPISHRFNVQILFLQKFTFVTLMIWYKSLFIKALPAQPLTYVGVQSWKAAHLPTLEIQVEQGGNCNSRV